VVYVGVKPSPVRRKRKRVRGGWGNTKVPLDLLLHIEKLLEGKKKKEPRAPESETAGKRMYSPEKRGSGLTG